MLLHTHTQGVPLLCFFDLSLSLSLSLAQKRVPVDFDSLQAGSDLRMDDFMTFVLWTALLRWHLGRHLS